MTSAESIQPASRLAEDISQRIRAILEGAPVSDYVQRQMQLVYEKAIKDNPDIILDSKTLDVLMLDWANSDFSRAFYLIAKSKIFATHPRFRDNIANITLEDVVYAVEKKAVPEI